MDNSTLDLLFPSVGGKEVVSRFDGGDITSDAGVLFVSLADRKIRLSEGLAGCIEDKRQQSKVMHSVSGSASTCWAVGVYSSPSR